MWPFSLPHPIALLGLLAACASPASALQVARNKFAAGEYAEAQRAADGLVTMYPDASELPAARFVGTAATVALAVSALDAGEWETASARLREYPTRRMAVDGTDLPILPLELITGLGQGGEPGASNRGRQYGIEGSCGGARCTFKLTIPAPKRAMDLVATVMGSQLYEDPRQDPGPMFGGVVSILGTLPTGPSRAWLAEEVCAASEGWPGWAGAAPARGCEDVDLDGLTLQEADSLLNDRCAPVGPLAAACTGGPQKRARRAADQRQAALSRLVDPGGMPHVGDVIVVNQSDPAENRVQQLARLFNGPPTAPSDWSIDGRPLWLATREAEDEFTRHDIAQRYQKDFEDRSQAERDAIRGQLLLFRLKAAPEDYDFGTHRFEIRVPLLPAENGRVFLWSDPYDRKWLLGTEQEVPGWGNVNREKYAVVAPWVDADQAQARAQSEQVKAIDHMDLLARLPGGTVTESEPRDHLFAGTFAAIEVVAWRLCPEGGAASDPPSPGDQAATRPTGCTNWVGEGYDQALTLP